MDKISWDKYISDTDCLSKMINGNNYDCLLAVSRGGTIMGTMLSHSLNLPMAVVISESYDDSKQQKEVKLSNIIFPPSIKEEKIKKIILIDDLLDTGNTYKSIKKTYDKWNFDSAVLYHKEKCESPNYYVEIKNDWIEFPYERF